MRTRAGHVGKKVAALSLLASAVLLTGMAPQTPTVPTYESVTAGTCSLVPSAAALPYYTAMRSGTAPLSPARVIQHVGTRLGFGLSPYGPLVPSKANNCTTLFFAEELARQLARVGQNQEHALLQKLRASLAPLTLFMRSDLNAAEARLKADAPDAPTALDYRWQAWNHVVLQMLLRELVGSQTVTPTGAVVDHQMNLEERLAEFWFNHFNVSSTKSSAYVGGKNGYADTLKGQIGGTFFGLLSAAIGHPGMIFYLDNQQNTYDAASGSAGNQNLARELLELHTFGQRPKHTDTDPASVYGQRDIEELAKLLAGWHTHSNTTPLPSADSGFVYHDLLSARLTVTFMGTDYPDTGVARVPAVLKWLANHPQTKQAICTKLANLFYAPSLVPGAASACVAAWGTDGQLKAMYAALLGRGEFWSAANYRTLYRTPTEVILATVRQMGVSVKDLEASVRLANLDSTFFHPANVSSAATFTSKLDAWSNVRIRRFPREIQLRIEQLSGVARTNVSAPTGYAQDGSVYLTTGYIDHVSRIPTELAGLFDLQDLSVRQDLTLPTKVKATTDAVTATNPTGPMWQYVVTGLNLGHVVNTPWFTESRSPYLLHATQQAALGVIATQSTTWPSWHPTSPTVGRREYGWPAAALGNAAQLRK